MCCVNSSDLPKIAVIISTTGRRSLIDRAVPSVICQSRPPNILYIVADSKEDLPTRNVSDFKGVNFPVKCLINIREKNLSGAMNTAFSQVLVDGFDPSKTFIAILDDDDWWEPDYLNSCYTSAVQNDSDWVVTGIIRHECDSDAGNYLTIPEAISEKSFLVGNPHIQGSNLFKKKRVQRSCKC